MVRRPIKTNQFEVIENIGEPSPIKTQVGRDAPAWLAYDGGREYADTGVAWAGAPLAYADTQSVVSHHTGDAIGEGRIVGSTMVDRKVTMQDAPGTIT